MAKCFMPAKRITSMDVVSLILNNLVQLIMLVDLVLIIALMFWEREDPRSSMLWVVVLIFLPIVGFFLYLFLGQTFYTERAFKRKAKKDRAQEDEVLTRVEEDEQARVAAERAAHPERAEKLRIVNNMIGAGAGLYTDANEVRFLPESQAYFDSLLRDLAAAEYSINFEYYIIRNDEISHRLMDILIDRAKHGVEVRLMIDAVGNDKGPKKKIKELRAAGGKYSSFHSMATCLLSPRKNNRNHRKIAVIDGQITYIGGFNIGDEYLGRGPLGYWRDSAVRVHGPAAVDAQFRFLADWRYATGEDLVLEQRFYAFDADLLRVGDESMMLVSGGPDVVSFNPVQVEYYNIIIHARRTLFIHTPYLGPDGTLSDALRNAALAGTDVRIIIPAVGDHPFVYWANRAEADRLMKYGVRVYEYRKGFVHSKTLVADGYYCSVGSANLDERSVRLNFETNALLFSEDIGRQMDAAFLADLQDCTEYTRAMFASRTLWQKFRTAVSRLVAPQL